MNKSLLHLNMNMHSPLSIPSELENLSFLAGVAEGVGVTGEEATLVVGVVVGVAVGGVRQVFA